MFYQLLEIYSLDNNQKRYRCWVHAICKRVLGNSF
jgi:hypothetical protein